MLPGSHFLFNLGAFMGHYGGIRGTASTAAPAGTIFITAYPIWHRRGASTAEGIRNMLKYLYWRMVPPQRDWIVEPRFQPRRPQRPALYGGKVHPAKDLLARRRPDRGDFHNFLGTDNWPIFSTPFVEAYSTFQNSARLPLSDFQLAESRDEDSKITLEGMARFG